MIEGGAHHPDYDDDEPDRWFWLRCIGYVVAFFLLMGLLVQTIQTQGHNLQPVADPSAVPASTPAARAPICGPGYVAVRLLEADNLVRGRDNATFCLSGYKP